MTLVTRRGRHKFSVLAESFKPTLCKPARTVASQRAGDTPCDDDVDERRLNVCQVVQISRGEGSVSHSVAQRLSWSEGDLAEACGLQSVIFRGKGSVL